MCSSVTRFGLRHIAVLGAPMVPALAGTAIIETKLTADDAAEGDYFGFSVSVSGDHALVGAWGDDDAGPLSGSAYVFERDAGGSWSQVAKLTASDAAESDFFGRSVSVSGDRTLVGAYFRDDDAGLESGSAYVFERDVGGSWSQVAKLTADDAAADDRFGYSVSVSGDRALVGAGWDDDGGLDSGSAYVFERDAGGSWSQVAKLTADDAAADDRFGYSVSVSGDRALVGAGWDDDGGLDSGSAYVFERDGGGTWSQVAKLTADDAAASRFGVSVSVDGDDALVGATGSAYVFERDAGGSWSQIAKLTADDAAAGDYFGRSVSVSRDRALVGADWDGDAGDRSGSAYVFELEDSGLSGACCIGVSCSDETTAACDTLDGLFAGAGTTCTDVPDPCSGPTVYESKNPARIVRPRKAVGIASTSPFDHEPALEA